MGAMGRVAVSRGPICCRQFERRRGGACCLMGEFPEVESEMARRASEKAHCRDGGEGEGNRETEAKDY